ncbi:MAG: ABC transporter substrate-binding protein [Lachnospiraceae bacterium]|nr:ABC transporter substrate-binding protein [Lachnospiraceae bacterium]MDY5701721.1 ABC transporter substrate-binding protein [Lachnospiraceae bacterium]
MKIKKSAALLMAAILTLSMTACGSKSETPAGTTGTGTETTAESITADNTQADGTDGTIYTVGICQLVQHDALDAATQGFKDALTAILGENVVFDEQNASGDSATCATIVNQFVANNTDLIMANATPALQAAVASTADIPIVATSVTDYATALDISDWNGTTGINVTGTADLAPLAEQAAMVKELIPDAKTVGILYCSAEANSKYQATVVSEELKALGFEVKEYTSADSNDVAMVTQAAVEECDVLYIPTDNTIAASAEIVNSVAEPAGIPIIAGEEGICRGCGIATLSIDYYSIGYRAGEMAADILTKGADPATMEIGYASDLTKKAMLDRCEALGISVPDDYEAITE